MARPVAVRGAVGDAGIPRHALAGLAAALLGAAAPPGAAAADLVVLEDGRPLRVERAREVPPDRLRLEMAGGRTVEVPRGEVRAVFPVPDLAAAARPHAERYADLARQLADRVHQDLQRSWTPPFPPGR